MSDYSVVFTPEAEAQFLEIYGYCAEHASEETAARYIDAIVSHCESLESLLLRGTPRDDIRAGVRLTHYRGRCVIAYAVEERRVVILGIFYGGRDYERELGQRDGSG